MTDEPDKGNYIIAIWLCNWLQTALSASFDTNWSLVLMGHASIQFSVFENPIACFCILCLYGNKCCWLIDWSVNHGSQSLTVIVLVCIGAWWSRRSAINEIINTIIQSSRTKIGSRLHAFHQINDNWFNFPEWNLFRWERWFTKSQLMHTGLLCFCTRKHQRQKSYF